MDIDIILTVDNKEQLVTINRNELNFEPKEYQQVIARVKQIGEKRINGGKMCRKFIRNIHLCNNVGIS